MSGCGKPSSQNRTPGGGVDGGSGAGYTTRSVAGWSSLVARRAHNPKVAGSNPAPAIERCTCRLRRANVGPRRRSRAVFSFLGWSGEGAGCGQVAQLVEHATENRSVGGSTPSLATEDTAVAQLVEHRSPKPAVGGSIPSCRAARNKGTPRSSSGLGHRPLTAKTGVRFPYGV